MCFLFPWPKLCPSNFFAKQLKLYHMEINVLMNTVRLEHISFRPIFGLLLSTTVDIVSVLFLPMQSFYINTKQLWIFDCNFKLASALTFFMTMRTIRTCAAPFHLSTLSLSFSQEIISYLLVVLDANGSNKILMDYHFSFSLFYAVKCRKLERNFSFKTTNKISNKVVLMSLKTNDLTCRLPL